jgi:hypothetical protein
MKNLGLGFFQLVVTHGTIGGAKVNRACYDLADSTPAANGLIIYLYLGMQLMVFAEPLRIHGIREGGASSIQGGLPNHGPGYKGAQQKQGESAHRSIFLLRCGYLLNF